MIRRRKKQLFDAKKKKKKRKSQSEKQKRSLSSSVFNVDWIFGESIREGKKKDKVDISFGKEKMLKSSTKLEIANIRVKSVASDFFHTMP